MSQHAHSAALSFSYPTAGDATIVERSLSVEVDQLDADRSTAGVRRSDRTVDVEIRAADLVALRAGLNSWLRYVSVAERVAGCESTRQS